MSNTHPISNTTFTAYHFIDVASDGKKLGSSEQEQLERIRAECARRGWLLRDRSPVFESGQIGFKRTSLSIKAALVEAAKQPRLAPNSVFVMESPDRLSHADFERAHVFLYELVRYNVEALPLNSALQLKNADRNSSVRRTLLICDLQRAHKWNPCRGRRRTSKKSL